MLDLSQMKQLEAKATKGPWVAACFMVRTGGDGHWSGKREICHTGGTVSYTGGTVQEQEDNASFLAASRTWIPDAIGEIERLRAVAVAAKELNRHERTKMPSSFDAGGAYFKWHEKRRELLAALDTALAAWEKTK